MIYSESKFWGSQNNSQSKYNSKIKLQKSLQSVIDSIAIVRASFGRTTQTLKEKTAICILKFHYNFSKFVGSFFCTRKKTDLFMHISIPERLGSSSPLASGLSLLQPLLSYRPDALLWRLLKTLIGPKQWFSLK